jgi:hypothetical protein
MQLDAPRGARPADEIKSIAYSRRRSPFLLECARLSPLFEVFTRIRFLPRSILIQFAEFVIRLLGPAGPLRTSLFTPVRILMAQDLTAPVPIPGNGLA